MCDSKKESNLKKTKQTPFTLKLSQNPFLAALLVTAGRVRQQVLYLSNIGDTVASQIISSFYVINKCANAGFLCTLTSNSGISQSERGNKGGNPKLVKSLEGLCRIGFVSAVPSGCLIHLGLFDGSTCFPITGGRRKLLGLNLATQEYFNSEISWFFRLLDTVIRITSLVPSPHHICLLDPWDQPGGPCIPFSLTLSARLRELKAAVLLRWTPPRLTTSLGHLEDVIQNSENPGECISFLSPLLLTPHNKCSFFFAVYKQTAKNVTFLEVWSACGRGWTRMGVRWTRCDQ